MRTRRLLIVLAVGVVAGIGFASPASAVAPPADGTYRLIEQGGGEVAWKLSSVCVQASGTRIQSDYTDPTIQTEGCTLNVTSSTPDMLKHSDKIQNYSTRAKISDGQWTFIQAQPQGMTCPDGSFAPTQEKFVLNDETMTGVHTTIHSAVCGGQPGLTRTPFSLQFVAPPGTPVERFPLYCDGFAHCW
ncbi:hypothetical protein FZI91_15480 [Mycobacterium sp. CBMA271]|uniref:hypothetical protein n=1 Tax=unclassified Mycobacteroides TaxID=2618759 RepID=UPI0013243D78|nr:MULTISPECIES: hypothetical protein [unclassified Mycobacteroides]MUM17628.1 hypothetical protein [Mycobacteroides sp. CBMA 326]MUM23097.1 hypothetical protein [Mycobacteroides sp. CBMA 271]